MHTTTVRGSSSLVSSSRSVVQRVTKGYQHVAGTSTNCKEKQARFPAHEVARFCTRVMHVRVCVLVVVVVVGGGGTKGGGSRRVCFFVERIYWEGSRRFHTVILRFTSILAMHV
jgi:hypothetical protein